MLVDHQVAKGCRQADRILELRESLLFRAGRRKQMLRAGNFGLFHLSNTTPIHRGRQVHHQIAGDVRLRLEFLDVVAIGLGINVPVEVLQIVAGRVLAMFRELDRKALEGAGMQAGEKPFDDELGPQVEPSNLGDDIRTKKTFRSGHIYSSSLEAICIPGNGLDSGTNHHHTAREFGTTGLAFEFWPNLGDSAGASPNSNRV